MSRLPTDVLVSPHWEDTDLVVMARVNGADASPITQSSVSSISVKVYDARTRELQGSALTLTVSDVVFNALQTDSRWTEDGTGYNFRATIPGTYFSSGGVPYRIEVVFTPTAGNNFPVVFEADTQELYSS